MLTLRQEGKEVPGAGAQEQAWVGNGRTTGTAEQTVHENICFHRNYVICWGRTKSGLVPCEERHCCVPPAAVQQHTAQQGLMWGHA